MATTTKRRASSPRSSSSPRWRSRSSAYWPSRSADWSLGDRKQGMKLRSTPLAAIVVAIVALALGLAACGEKSEDGGGEAQPFRLALDFYPNPDHAGIYMAKKLGYFHEA